jgi:hypothetical protein
MATWVPGCQVTSSDASVGVTPAPGGGSNLSSLKSNIVDATTTLVVPITTPFTANTAIPITNGGAATTYNFVRGGTYSITAPVRFVVGAVAIAVPAGSVGSMLVYPVVNTAGTAGAVTLDTIQIPVPVSSLGTVPATLTLQEVYSSTFTVNPTTWGPLPGAANYNPLTVPVTFSWNGSVNGVTGAPACGMSIGSAVGAVSPVVITRIA